MEQLLTPRFSIVSKNTPPHYVITTFRKLLLSSSPERKEAVAFETFCIYCGVVFFYTMEKFLLFNSAVFILPVYHLLWQGMLMSVSCYLCHKFCVLMSVSWILCPDVCVLMYVSWILCPDVCVMNSVSWCLCPLFNKNGSSTRTVALFAVFLTSCCLLSILKALAFLHLTFRLVYGFYFPGNPTCIRTSQSITASCLAISDLQKTTCYSHKQHNWIWRVAMFTTQAFTPLRGPSASKSQPVSILKQKKVLVPRTIPLLLSFFVMPANTAKLFKRNNKELMFWVSLGRYSCSTTWEGRPYGQSVSALCAVGTEQRPCVLQKHAVCCLWPVPLHSVKRYNSKLSMLWHRQPKWLASHLSRFSPGKCPCVYYTVEILAGTEKCIWDDDDQTWRGKVTSNPALLLRIILKWVLNVLSV